MANDEQEKKKKEEEKKKKEKKQRAKKMKIMLMVAKILIIVLLVVLIAGALFAIIEAILRFIIDIVNELVTALLKFFKDPIAALERGWAKFKNWLNKKNDDDPKFDPTEFEQLRTDAVVTISDAKVQEMILKLENSINRETAGLDDVMLKKLIVAYYRGLYLDDTYILVEITAKDLGITDGEWNDMFITQAYKRRVLGEDDKWNTGDEDGNYVLDENGNVKIYKDTKDGKYEGKGQEFWPGIVTGSELDDFKDHFNVGKMWAPNREVRYILTSDAKTFLNNFAEQVYPFQIIEGEPDYLLGDDGKLYIRAKGMVQVYVDPNSLKNEVAGDLCGGCQGENMAEKCKYWSDEDSNTVCYYKLRYYQNMLPGDEDSDVDVGLINLKDLLVGEATIDEKDYYKEEDRPFLKLYKYYLYHNNVSDYEAYTEEIYKYLATCYTYSEKQDKILMASERTVEKIEKTWQFGATGVTRRLENTSSKSEDLQVIEYQSKISEYANPVEFMVALMEHTAGREFVNAFIEKTGKETYIKMRLYLTGDEEETLKKVEKNRETTVTIIGGKQEPSVEITGVYQYRQKTGGFTGMAPTYEWREASAEYSAGTATATLSADGKKGSVTVTLNKVSSSANDTKVKVNFCGIEKEISGFKTGKLSITQSWEIPSSWPNTTTDLTSLSNIIEYTKTTKKVSKYEAAIKSLKTWYATKTATNIEYYNFNINFETPGEGGITEEKNLVVASVSNPEEVEQYLQGVFNDENNPTEVKWGENTYPLTVYKSNEKYVWEGTTQTRNPDTDNQQTAIDNGLFEYDVSIFTKLYGTYTDCLRYQYMWTVNYDEANQQRTDVPQTLLESSTYKKTMSAVDTNIKSIKYTKSYKKELWPGDLQGIGTETNDYNTFLSLLSNETGIYDKNAMYKSEDTGGKTVIYKDVYGGPSKPAYLLINGEEQIDYLLRNTTAGDPDDPTTLTELANAFKLMLYYYRSGNSSATSPDDLEYIQDLITVNSST